MTAKEFLEQLNPNSKVFDISVEYKYTEDNKKVYEELRMLRFLQERLAVLLYWF
jgi:hypothetical protein